VTDDDADLYSNKHQKHLNFVMKMV